MKRWLCLLIVLTGCVDLNVPKLLPQKPELLRPPPPDPEVYTPAPGSLWRGDASRRFLAFENRAKRIGDLVTVTIDESATALSEATTELDRKSKRTATIDSDISLQTLVSRPILSVLDFLGFSDQKTDKTPTAELEMIKSDSKSEFDGEGMVEREASFTTTVACIVMDASPSGLLYIKGERHMQINGETQIIEISGYVRPEDIRLDNTIPSTLIASADIHYGGHGVVADQQRLPWLSRLFSMLLPF